MIKETLSQGGWSILGEIALVLFVLAFVLVLIGEAIRPRRQIDHLSHLPMDDAPAAPQRSRR
jgi:hypothetical protein